MTVFKSRKDRFWTYAVLVISVAGVLFFGYQAIRESTVRNQRNPFEYDIDRFRETDSSLVHFSEATQIPLEMPHVYGLAVGPDDHIFVSGDEAIHIYNPDGAHLSAIDVAEPVRCLTIDSNRDIYAGTNNHVEVYDSEGIKKAEWVSPGGETMFTSIALSSDFVFVADAGNLIVWKYDKSGNLLQRIGDEDEKKDIPGFVIPSGYFDVAVDPDGFLWAANAGRHSIENFTTDGNFRTSWGQFSMDIDGFCGCCNPTHFIVLEDGSFVTSEKGIARIKVHNQLGEVVSLVAGPDEFEEGTVGLDLAVDSAQRILVLDPRQNLIRVFVKDQERV